MKDEPRGTAKHQLDHAVPTVIHNPDEGLPLLARWVRHAMEDRARFWSLFAAFVVVVVGLTVLVSGFSLSGATVDEAWSELDRAKSSAERIKVAEKYPSTPAGRWALLQAATDYYMKGFADLPANRDVALPDLKKALEYFQKVADEAPKDSPQARAAALGIARTHEARNELEKAIQQYEKVAKLWPDSKEAADAKAMADALKRPESADFYRELYTYKAPEMTLPPAGVGELPLPPGHPSLDGPTFPSPDLLPPPPPTSSGTGSSSQGSMPALPANPFAPSSKAEPAKAPAKAELPADPFATPSPAPKP
jgi:hypothetical protein